MRRRAVHIVLSCALICGSWCAVLCTRSAWAETKIDPAELTDAHVNAAIDALVEELYRRKQPDIYWEPEVWKYARHGSDSQVGGYTALAALALLYAGESYQSPRLADAIEQLKRDDLNGTYAVAARAHVWSLLPDRFHDRLHADAQWLMNAYHSDVNGWYYTPSSTRGDQHDNSLTQYGALGLWEAAKRGVDVDTRYWQGLENRYINNQLAEGSWNYRSGRPGTGSMTTAGLMVLFIAQDFLHAESFERLPHRQIDQRPQRAIDLGMNWMREHFSATENPGFDRYFFYYLYGIERVGLASGHKFFGDHDWFREGAAELIHRLCAWDDETQTMSVHETMYGDGRRREILNQHLSFALMFLSRGRVPVAINKLQSEDFATDNRPRDVANLTRRLSSLTETTLNWQIIDADRPPETWLDAPMVYLASNDDIAWIHENNQPAESMRRRLKRYLDLGGMIFAVNEGRNVRFARTVEQLGSMLYPAYAWRPLQDDHWAYTMLRPVGGRRPTLRALSNGVRELMILSPSEDFSRVFQVADEPGEEQAVYDTAFNIYLYASEKNRPRPRLATHVLLAESAQARTTVSIVRARYDGNWNPEPAALDVLDNVMRRRHDTGLNIQTAALESIHTLDTNPALVIVSGVDEHELTPPERHAIKQYVEAGGMILFETTGGRGDFTLAVERTAVDIFSKVARPLRRSALITGENIENASDITRVTWRPYALQIFGTEERANRLRATRIEGEPRVLFSREDLSHGLLDQPCWGIVGYTPNSARHILNNIIQYAIQKHKLKQQ